MQQLEGKDSLMANMTAQLRAKDQQLTSLMDLLTDDNNKVGGCVCVCLSLSLPRFGRDSVRFAIIVVYTC